MSGCDKTKLSYVQKRIGATKRKIFDTKWAVLVWKSRSFFLVAFICELIKACQ